MQSNAPMHNGVQCITMHGWCFHDALRLCTNAQLCVQMHPSHWQCTICVCKLPRLLHTHVHDFSCIDTACKVGTLVSALLCIVVHCQCRFGTLVYAFLCIVVAVCNAFKCKAKQCIMSLNAPQCTKTIAVHCGAFKLIGCPSSHDLVLGSGSESRRAPKISGIRTLNLPFFLFSFFLFLYTERCTLSRNPGILIVLRRCTTLNKWY